MDFDDNVCVTKENATQQKPPSKPTSSRFEIKLSEIILFNKLGSGASGSVKKAIHKPTKKMLAMKEIRI
jgi:serine/threonine protein kinase